MPAKNTQTETAVVEAPAEAPVAEAKPKKQPRFLPLEAERAAWVLEHARPAESPCLCGCGQSTKGRFVPGHDATLKETLRATLGLREPEAKGTPEQVEIAQATMVAFGW